jgi:co-chaperonin GroES (HSP10)
MQTLGRAILIKPDVLPARTKTGQLLIPETSQEMKPETGTVIQAGPACEIAKVGDRVKFPRKSCSVAVIDGEDMLFTYEYRCLYYEEKDGNK